MCESGLGVSTPWTRQISGIDFAPGNPSGGASGVRGGTKVPAATTVAELMDVFGNETDFRLSHVAPEAARATATMRTMLVRTLSCLLLKTSRQTIRLN